MSWPHTELLDQFKHRPVRDLAWVIASPPLVSGLIDDVHWWNHAECLSEFNDCLIELKNLDQNPKPLTDHLNNLKNKKLGSVFEGLISFWLHISPNYQEKLHNVQIIEDKHTYGEIDFIIEEIATGKNIHLEVAVKFYLGCEPLTDAYRWFGTTIADQLGKKVNHLRSHQTQLTKNYPEQLKAYFPQKIDERQCIMKGRLFYPEVSDTAPQSLALAHNHLRGRWSYVENIEDIENGQYKKNSNSLIKINKSDWLAEFSPQDIKDSKLSSIESLKSIDRAECYVETEITKNRLFEKQRIFYLPKSFIFPRDE